MRRDAVLVGVLAGALLVARPLCDAGPQAARLAAAWLTLLGLPALLLAVPFGRGRGPLGAAAVGIAAAVGVFSGLAFLLEIAGAGLTTLLALYPACVVGVAGARLVLEARRPEAAGAAPARGAGRGAGLLAIAAGGLLLFIGTWRERPVDFRMDVYDHVGAAARVEARDRIFSREMGDGDEGDHIDPRKGTWNTLLAAALRLSDADRLLLWRTATLVASLVTLLAFARVAREFLGAAWPLGALLLFLAQEGGPGGAWLSRSAYPGNIALSLYAIFLAESLAVARGRRGAPLLAALGLAFVHLLAGAFAILASLCLLPLGLRERAVPRERARFAAGIAATAALVGGIALWRAVAAGPLTNEIQTELQGVLFLGGGFFVPEPRTFTERLGAEGIIGLLAAPFLIEKARRDLGLAWVLLLAALILLLASPPLATLLGRRIGYLLRRIPALTPLPLLIGFLAVEFARAARAPGRGLGALGPKVGLVALLALPAIRVGQAAALALEQPRHATAAAAGETRWTPDLLRIAERLPAGARVATDPVTGYALYARTSARPFVLPDQHAAPNDAGAVARLTDLARILSPWTLPDERRALLAEREASHVLVNEGLGEDIRTYGLPLSPDNLTLLKEVIEGSPHAYTLVAKEGSLSLFEVSGGLEVSGGPDADPSPGVPANPYVGGVPAVPSGEGSITTDAGVLVARPTLGETRARPGELVTVRCTLARPPADPPVGDYLAFLAVASNRHAPGPLPKVARGLRGLAGRPTDRVLFEREIAGGRYPVLLWKTGEAVADTFWIRVPSGMPPGEYHVTMNVVRTTYFPNRTLRFLFTDEDEYARVPVGTLVVAEDKEGV